jgi:hypothetical protein
MKTLGASFGVKKVRGSLIPRPGVIRVELARVVREARRLRSLLRLSMQAEADREFIEGMRGGSGGG